MVTHRQDKSTPSTKLLSAEAAKERRSIFFHKLQPSPEVNVHQPQEKSVALPEEALALKLADDNLRVERLVSMLRKNNSEIIKYPLTRTSASRVEVWQDVLTRHGLSKLAFSAESWFASELKEAITNLGAELEMKVFYTDKKHASTGAGYLHTTEGKLAFAEHDAGITSVTAGIAVTGSLLLVPTIDEPRSLSLVPPVHIAVLRKADVVTNLHEWIASHKEVVASSHFVLISGPSKTADIEKRLVYGVHGPKKLIVLLCE